MLSKAAKDKVNAWVQRPKVAQTLVVQNTFKTIKRRECLEFFETYTIQTNNYLKISWNTLIQNLGHFGWLVLSMLFVIKTDISCPPISHTKSVSSVTVWFQHSSFSRICIPWALLHCLLGANPRLGAFQIWSIWWLTSVRPSVQKLSAFKMLKNVHTAGFWWTPQHISR